jgi:hypothetical protein
MFRQLPDAEDQRNRSVERANNQQFVIGQFRPGFSLGVHCLFLS